MSDTLPDTERERVERVARAICLEDGLNPDDTKGGLLIRGREGFRPHWEGYEEHARAALAAADQWLPIESAPRDGTPILAWSNLNGIVLVYFDDDGREGYSWVVVESRDSFATCAFTHFRPLPPPPKEAQ